MREKSMKKALSGIIAAVLMIVCMGTTVFAGGLEKFAAVSQTEEELSEAQRWGLRNLDRPEVTGMISEKAKRKLVVKFKKYSRISGHDVLLENLKNGKTSEVHGNKSVEKITLQLDRNTFYKARIRGFYFGGTGEKIASMYDTFYLAHQPTAKSKKNGSGARITWTKVTGTTNYIVYLSQNKNYGYKKYLTTTSTSCKLSKAEIKKYKYVYIQANKKYGGETFSTSFSFYNKTNPK